MTRSNLWARLRDERGVALPLALVGLVSISLLVTTALITSSTEVAISRAHEDATVSLYRAEGVLQEYVGRKALGQSQATPANPLVEVAGDAQVPGFLVTATQLALHLDTLPNKTLRMRETFGLLAEPAGGSGRRVAAQVTAARLAALFDLSVNAGLTVGGDLDVGGNSTISDGRSADCDSAAAPNAVEVSAGSTITKRGSSRIEGVADTANYSKADMVSLLLNGLSLHEAAKLAGIKFGPGELSGRARSYTADGPAPKSDKYNWGCPANSDDPCTTAPGNQVNLTYFPMIAIDAGGGKVTLEGNHGQGILIVHNGSIEIRGNFVFEGIVLVERDLDVTGTGGTGTKLEGAVVALGQNSNVEDNATGNAVITYNKCIISAAEAAANQQRIWAAPQTFPSLPLAWQEVVR